MASIIQRAFAGGEIDPRVYARCDEVKYATGLRTMRNMIIMKHGGAANRPGTVHVGEVKDSTKKVRLIPFEFSNDQTYVLEFGNLYMRVIKNGAYIPAFELATPYLTADLPLLKFTQSADVLTVVHENYTPAEIARLADNNWTYTAITFGAAIFQPTFLGAIGGAVGQPTSNIYTVSSVDQYGDESLATFIIANPGVAALGSNPVTLSWTAAAGAIYYKIYKGITDAAMTVAPGVYGFIGTSTTTGFVDNGITPDFLTTNFTFNKVPFHVPGPFYPSCVSYVQQRLVFGNKFEQVFMSKTGRFKNFNRRIPVLADDEVEFNLAGKKVNPVKHILDIGFMVLFTANGAYGINMDGSPITPSNINPKQQAGYGCSDLRPIAIGQTAVYAQDVGFSVRGLGFKFQTQGYDGDDLTIFAAHLFEGYSLVDWDYQQNPNSIIWAARSDGSLLGFTYIEGQQIWGWHRHDLDGGFVENVCSVRYGNEDRIYLTVRRTINGVTKRYVEYFDTRLVTDVTSARFMDSSVSYDGTNTNLSNTMTISGSGFTYQDLLTLTANVNTFTIGDIGNAIHLTGSDGTIIRFNITGYTSAKIVTGFTDKNVPASMQSVGILTWKKAIKIVTGLAHLEGKNVSIFADGFVVGSPNNNQYPVYTVTGGSITLDRPYGIIHVGLPFISDIETLDIDMANGPAISTYNKHINQVAASIYQSRGFFAGSSAPDGSDALEGLYEYKARNLEGYEDPVSLASEVIKVNIESSWNSNGRVFIRQVDPLPLTILSIVASGDLPVKG